jgi:hypothetical protein
MKKILFLSAISFAIFADLSFYDLVKSDNLEKTNTNELIYDYTTSSNQNQNLDLLAQLGGFWLANSNDGADLSQKLVNQSKDPGLINNAYNNVKKFLRWGDNASVQVARGFENDVNPDNMSLLAKIKNSYEHLKTSGQRTFNTLADYAKKLL